MLKPENKDLYFRSLGGSQQLDQVICVEELKLYLLAKTCICPGINTLISLLITNCKPEYKVATQDELNQVNWVDDYMMGMQNEIYRVLINGSIFEGISFNILAKSIYNEFQYILIAVEVNVLDQYEVFLNPTDYLFDDQDHYVYMLANSQPDFERLNKFEIND